MKNWFSVILALCFCLRAWAEGPALVRYKDVVFTNWQVDSVAYTVVNGRPLLMDVYQPTGDTAVLRPLIIFAHGGSFMHGDRHVDRMHEICSLLAKRGYVAVSIDYRLTNLAGMATRRTAYNEIMKAVA
ncbi:MAG TPA: hypothetical protein VG603_03680, partial [Chitinophagales bacterium]|nr:hypothetical protein [Chitinophagales bacterium]